MARPDFPLHSGVTLIPSSEAPGHTNYRALAERMGADMLERRVIRQGDLWARDVHQGEGILKIERALPVDQIIALFLKLTGLRGVGRRNLLAIEIVERDVILPGLPAKFDGFRLLQLADLHCDLDPALVDVVIERLAGLTYDVAVLTGDYHNKIGKAYDLSLDLMAKLLTHLRGPRYGVLGNHDFIEKVAFLEAAGLPMLLNEAASIERDGERLWICGVDDAHFFRTEDLARARAQVPPNETAILLSHSPEPYAEADRLGYRLMLSGHTHGGQICWPNGTAVIKNYRGPLWLMAGEWSYGRLQGYTSRGTGGCGVAARFFCRPEMTIHTLRAGPIN